MFLVEHLPSLAGVKDIILVTGYNRDLSNCLHSLIIKNISNIIGVPQLEIYLPKIRNSGWQWQLGDRKEHVVMYVVP